MSDALTRWINTADKSQPYWDEFDKAILPLILAMPFGLVALHHHFFGEDWTLYLCGILGVLYFMIGMAISGNSIIGLTLTSAAPLVIAEGLSMLYGITFLNDALVMSGVLLLGWWIAGGLVCVLLNLINRSWSGRPPREIAHGITLSLLFLDISIILYTEMGLSAGYIVVLYSAALSLFCYQWSRNSDDYNPRRWEINTGICPLSEYVNVLYEDGTLHLGQRTSGLEWSLAVEQTIARYRETGQRRIRF